jgi:hypothetical protein
VPRGDDAPYAIDDNKIYVRNEAETNLAVRDEIVQLVRRSRGMPAVATPPPAPPVEAEPVLGEAEQPAPQGEVEPSSYEGLRPRTGVEIVSTEEREGTRYHTMRDLRNGSIVQNVTRKSARKLWHYAITQHEGQPLDTAQIAWRGDLGMLESSKRAGKVRYDLIQRLPDGRLRVYYGVTEDGIHGEWKKVVGLEE